MYSSTFIQETLLHSCRTLLILNTKTNQIYNYKLEDQMGKHPDVPLDGEKFWKDVTASGHIHEADLWQFEILSTPKLLTQVYREINEGSAIVYRYKKDGHYRWSRIDILFPRDYSEENPCILLFSRSLTRSEATISDSFFALSKKMARIAIVNLSADHYDTIHDLFDHSRNLASQKRGCISSEILFTGMHCVHADDADLFLKRVSNDYILKWFDSDNTEYNHYYRRLIDGVYRWVHLYIIKTDNYRKDHQEFYYFVEDAHDVFLRLLDQDAMSGLTRYCGHKNENDLYYANLLKVLDGLTSEYLDFYMIDLERDLYIKYKVQSLITADYVPPVGSYTKMSERYIRENFSGAQSAFLQKFSSSDKLRRIMQDRLVLEYSFYTADHVYVKTICQKIESKNGLPTKLLCKTVLANEEHKLIVKTFGNFDVFTPDGTKVLFGRKQSKQLFAYLIDRQGFPVTSKDIAADVLEKPMDDINAIKYVSTLVKRTMDDLKSAGYPNVIIKEQKTLRVDPTAVNCDYYQLKNGNFSALSDYRSEYMKEYSWAEDTNAEITMMIEDIHQS